MVDFDIEYNCHSAASLCSLARMLLTHLPPEIVTIICSYLPLQDVKNVAQILPVSASVFKNWSKLQNIFTYIQNQANIIKTKNKLKHLHHANMDSEQFRHMDMHISPKKYFMHIMITDQNWFESSSPFYVKETLNYMLDVLNSIKLYYDFVNNE